MATAKELSELIEAVRALAKSDEDIQSTINANARRGDILETEVRADIADSQDECCSDKGNGGGGDDGPCDTPASDIWCNPDEPWVDCDTGKPVTVNPGGFPQAEDCKQCEPDDTWEEGYFWKVVAPISDYNSYGDTPWQAVLASPYYPKGGDSIRQVSETLYYWEFDGVGSTSYSVVRGSCPPSQEAIDAGFGSCASEAPENCGEDWEQDAVTDLAIIAGCITGSKCDPDASAGDQHCKKCRNICGPNGQKIQVCAQGNGDFTAEDPSNPGYGTRYNRYGIKQYDYTPDIGS